MIKTTHLSDEPYFNELYDKYKYDEYNKFEYSDSEYNELVKMREDLKKEIEA